MPNPCTSWRQSTRQARRRPTQTWRRQRWGCILHDVFFFTTTRSSHSIGCFSPLVGIVLIISSLALLLALWSLYCCIAALLLPLPFLFLFFFPLVSCCRNRKHSKKCATAMRQQRRHTTKCDAAFVSTSAAAAGVWCCLFSYPDLPVCPHIGSARACATDPPGVCGCECKAQEARRGWRCLKVKG